MDCSCLLYTSLVGLWTVGNSAWTGDYHFNVNVQMNYWPVYATNLAECGTTFVDYMDKLREPGRLTAERVHGIEGAVKNHTGFTVHTENNPFGMTAPTNAQEYGWNPTGAAWAIQNLWWHYEFTQDEAYLKNTIYPIMKEAALFWDSYLWTSEYQKINDENSPYNGQNRLVVAPSFSEEQGPTAVGTTYDQSLVWELYNECIKAGKIVGEDEALLKSWEEKMQKLDPIEINDTNGIKEWYEETRVGQKNGHNQSCLLYTSTTIEKQLKDADGITLEVSKNGYEWTEYAAGKNVDARYVRLINKTDAKKTFDIRCV